MNALTPTEQNTTGVGIDAVIETLRLRLDTLPFIQFALGRIYPQMQTDKSKPEPWLYRANGEYYKAYPNDTLNSFCCFFPAPRTTIDGSGMLRQRKLAVIVWLDLRKLGLLTPTIEEQKEQVISALQEEYVVMSADSDIDQNGIGGGIYEEFDTSGFDVMYMTYPYAGFRINLTVHYSSQTIC